VVSAGTVFATVKADMNQKHRPPEFIVVDTTVIVDDYWFRSPSFELFAEFLKQTGAKFVVPEVVVEEAINHRHEDLEIVKSEIEKAHRKVARLFRRFPEKSDQMAVVETEDASDPYEKFLSSELKRRGATIIPYHDIPHKDVISRDLSRFRPFQRSGKGYRDTLIWETIVRNCLKKGAVTVFVTDNSKDFCDPQGELHEDLRKDLRARGFDEADFKISKDLIHFTDVFAVPLLTAGDDFIARVAQNEVPGFDLPQICDDNISAIVGAIEKKPASMIGDPGVYEPSVDVVYVPSKQEEFEILSAARIAKNTFFIVFKFRANVAFAYFLSHSQYATLPESEVSRITVLDWEWNEFVMRVGSDTDIDLKCRITFDAKKQVVQSFEVEDVEGVEEEY
jgi:predicted nucleic acid-binding protein